MTDSSHKVLDSVVSVHGIYV